MPTITSTALLPVRPFDGAYITNRLVNLAISVLMLGCSAVLLLGWA